LEVAILEAGLKHVGSFIEIEMKSSISRRPGVTEIEIGLNMAGVGSTPDDMT